VESVDPRFFPHSAEFNAWLAEHHDSEDVLWVGYYKKSSGKPSVTWEETVDEALCYGWIDGLRKSIDDKSYRIRFTPRKPRSIWSQRNIDRVAVLTEQGRMKPSGLAAYAHHDKNPRSGYRVSEFVKELPEAMLAEIRKIPGAWDFYKSQPLGYRRNTTRWITTAQREETKRRRLATLIEDASNGLRIKHLR